eukprot:47116-Eustigmatos_ZCMA.PRE.1
MGFVDLVDRVSQVTTAPIFKAMHSTAAFGHEAGVALDHGGDLLALIRVDHKHDFVMTHGISL